MDAAERLLRERSYDAVSMEAVAEAACVTRRTVYNHFVDRAALYAAVREREIIALGSKMHSPVPLGRPVHQTLVDFATAAIDVLSDPSYLDFVRSVIQDGAHHRWLVDTYVRNIRLPVVQALEIYLLRLTAAGELDIPDIHLAARHFVGSLEALVAMPRLLGTEELTGRSKVSLAQHVVDMFLLGTPGAASEAARRRRMVIPSREPLRRSGANWRASTN